VKKSEIRIAVGKLRKKSNIYTVTNCGTNSR